VETNVFLGFFIFLLLIFTPFQLVGEETREIPSWIKNNAQWWSDNSVSTLKLNPSQSMKAPYVFDGREICMENPCPQGPNEICFPNTPEGHAMFIAMINDLCAFRKPSGAWDVFDLPRPAPVQKPNIRILSPEN